MVKWFVLLVILLFLLFFLIWFLSSNESWHKKNRVISEQENSSVVQTPDSNVLVTDSVQPKDTSTSPVNRIDTVPKKKVKKGRMLSPKKDTVVQQNSVIKDTVVTSSAIVDSSDSIIAITDPCSEDTAALWVYPNPSGGLHRKAVSISMISNKDCKISYRFAGGQAWTDYLGEEIPVNATSTLQFIARDSCGHQMEMREEYYEIDVLNIESPCPSGMELITVGESKFCIDRYEWPNQKGVVPRSYVSLYQAMDSCYSVGKRLCTSEEWMLSCSGPHTWAYPYGQQYERYACATHDKKVSVSGSRPECRSFFGVYDMSGSLLEWTSTRAADNRQFYYVMGGFWESGPQSGCSEKRYSYFPENQHNPVGFRCCADLPEQSGRDVKKVQKGSKR
ncbi:MAG TPA: SUMF1/EgtB/PvdO family nonheme iron enzyme [Chitinispirillaceae bacterium]|nr:SUMF1/EgtB/PvdO family nonheme iron enzyme [Chitinispirillaceae bacterium]